MRTPEPAALTSTVPAAESPADTIPSTTALTSTAPVATSTPTPVPPTPTPVPTPTPKPTPTATPTPTEDLLPPVVLTLNAVARGMVVTIQGRATVPDGALIAYEVSSIDDMLGACLDCIVDGITTVKGGMFSVDVDLSGWPPGDIWVWITFQTLPSGGISQPDKIIALYGEKGARITRPNVARFGSVTRVEVEQVITLVDPR